ncbi:CIC11C00000002081 [Sungouiella intermedia]|uniref:CIC11C00000002081 n=1 Tax=Sungouiella intermedia TaxID=45354 RepID=A0A1L0D969_9ASCO|nr:CIC11C00000002081 [[Candida] intermedia]
MAQLKHKNRKNADVISKSRAAKASLLTGMTVVAFLQLLYHAYWAISSVYSHRFGGKLNSLAVVIGTLALNLFVTIKVLLFFETRLLSDQIDADHKKYL